MEDNQKLSNKNIIIILLIFVVTLVSITPLIAYITRSTIAKNIITFGNLKMQLIETTLDENNEEIEVADDENINITHNPVLSRIVKIKNLGNHDFFARISIHLLGIDNDNQKLNADEYIEYDFNTEDWIYKNGWYYYKKIVKQNEITSNLITEIKFDINNITTRFPCGNFQLDIKAEVVQAENNAKNVLDVMGWPSE